MTWLADLHDKAGKATPGPWYPVLHDMNSGVRTKGRTDHFGRDDLVGKTPWNSDAEFIGACSPERVRVLCELAEAAGDLLDGWKRERAGFPLYYEAFSLRTEYARNKLAALASLEPAP